MRRIKRSPRLVISSPNINSNALKALANSLSQKVGYRVWRVTPDRVRGRPNISFLGGIDKREQFRRFHESGVAAPAYCLNPAGVASIDARRIVARTLTSASEGKGIVIFDKGTTPPAAPLYTAYIPKKKEFRVHVYNGAVIHVSEKRKRKAYEGQRDAEVRNTVNGYVFCTNNVVEPGDLRDTALAAVRSLGRSYGAVDVIWQEKSNKCFALEVNSRPGLEGTTVEKYAQAILQGLNNVLR
jgi:hypothetical protein